MERKIGEIFEFGGEWYQCIPDTTDDNCNNCYFQKDCSNITGSCSSTTRSDGKSVAFKKLEKVGEPYISSRNKRKHQLYRCFHVPIITTDSRIEIGDMNFIGIEIKQTNKDMEENKSNLKPFDLQQAKEEITTEQREKSEYVDTVKINWEE